MAHYSKATWQWTESSSALMHTSISHRQLKTYSKPTQDTWRTNTQTKSQKCARGNAMASQFIGRQLTRLNDGGDALLSQKSAHPNIHLRTTESFKMFYKSVAAHGDFPIVPFIGSLPGQVPLHHMTRCLRVCSRRYCTAVKRHVRSGTTRNLGLLNEGSSGAPHSSPSAYRENPSVGSLTYGQRGEGIGPTPRF